MVSLHIFIGANVHMKTLKGHSGFVRSVAFSSDGETLASGSDDYTIKLWDVASGQELKTLKGHSLKVWTIAFSPDCKMLASGSHDKTLKVWDVASGQELKTLKEHSLPVTTVAFSPDGKTLASGSWRNAIKLWDVVSGHELKSVKGNSNPVQSVAFSPDGKTLASGGDDNTINLWDVTSGQELKILKGHSLYVNSIAFSPDGKTLASGSLDKTIKLWDVASGQELQTLKGHSLPVWTIAFSPDGKTLASGSLDNTIKLWDLASGQELKTLKHSPRVWTMAFSPDGKTLASGSMDSTIKLWNVASGQELKTLKGHSLYVNSIAFSPDGKTLASGSYDNTIKLWNMASGQELKTLKGHSGVVVSVTFSPDGKTLASGGFDSTIKLWEVSSGNNLASLIALDETDWAVVTPDGLFDGSPNAWKQLIWRLDNNTFKYASVEAFFKEFYYPGLLQEIMEGKRPRPPVKNLSEVDIRQPGVSIRRVGGQPVQERGLGQPVTLTNAVLKRNVEVEIQVTDNNSPPSRPSHPATNVAQDLRLFRNGSLVKLWRGVLFDKQSGCDQIASKLRAPARAVCKVTIPLVAGDNNLTAYAFNHENIKSNDGEALVKGAESLRRAGTLYTLAIGVNEYANSQYNLKYAAADAQGFAGELKRQQAKLKNYERVELISLIDKDATKTNILKSLADLSAKIQPEDALVIYFAGHGTAQQNRFYLIPHDLGYAGSRTQLNDASLKNILAHSISDEELEAAVEGIDAGQMLLVIDACNSGQALEAEEKRRGPMNSKGLAQLAYEKGMYILTAAQSYQAAKEAAKLGHGFLTYALVEEGLKTPVADREPKDGQVLLREWLDFATERVPQMQQDEIKKRQLVQEKSGAAVRPNDDNLQRPRVFYRRETEPHPLVVARP